MEKFMFLYRGGDFRSLSPEAMQANMQRWFAWMDKLRKKEILIDSSPLQPSGKQVNGKNKTVTDGPYTEAKEMIGGYSIILASDIDEAATIAGDCPIFDLNGKLEVRPLQNVQGQAAAKN